MRRLLIPIALVALLSVPVAAEEAGALFGQGRYLEQNGDLEGASQAYQRLFESVAPLNPYRPRAVLRFGICQQELGQTDVARAAFESLKRTYADRADLCWQAEVQLALMEGRTPPPPPDAPGPGRPGPGPPGGEQDRMLALRRAYEAMGLPPEEVERRLQEEAELLQRRRLFEDAKVALAEKLRAEGLDEREIQARMRQLDAELRHRIQGGRHRPTGPPPWQEEMRRLRQELHLLRQEVEHLRREMNELRQAPPRPGPGGPRPGGPPPRPPGGG